MMDDRKPTQEEINRVRRYDCATRGHEWEIIEAEGRGPVSVLCGNCGKEALSHNERRELIERLTRTRNRIEEIISTAEHERRQAVDRGHNPGSAPYEKIIAKRKAFEDALSLLRPVLEHVGIEGE